MNHLQHPLVALFLAPAIFAAGCRTAAIDGAKEHRDRQGPCIITFDGSTYNLPFPDNGCCDREKAKSRECLARLCAMDTIETKALCQRLEKWSGYLVTAPGRTIYVSARGGSDRNDGTKWAPFKTIQRAADTVAPGDTVVVRDGVYGVETIGDLAEPWRSSVVAVRRGGTPDNWVRFVSENRGGARISGSAAVGGMAADYTTRCWSFDPGDAPAVYGSVGYVQIEGFDISKCAVSGISINKGTGHVVIKGNKIHDIGRRCGPTQVYGGIFVQPGCNYVNIEGNAIHDIGQRGWPTDPVPLDRKDPGTARCTVTGSDGKPIFPHLHHGLYLHGSHIQVVNNIFYENNSGADIKISASSVGSGIDYRVVNNTMGRSHAVNTPRIILDGNTRDILIRNNIISPYNGHPATPTARMTGKDGVKAGPDTDPSFWSPAIYLGPYDGSGKVGVIVENNLANYNILDDRDLAFFYGIENTTFGDLKISGNLQGTENGEYGSVYRQLYNPERWSWKWADPRFVNYDNYPRYDLHLKADSPAIGLAFTDGNCRPDGMPKKDFDGRPRCGRDAGALGFSPCARIENPPCTGPGKGRAAPPEKPGEAYVGGIYGYSESARGDTGRKSEFLELRIRYGAGKTRMLERPRGRKAAPGLEIDVLATANYSSSGLYPRCGAGEDPWRAFYITDVRFEDKDTIKMKGTVTGGARCAVAGGTVTQDSDREITARLRRDGGGNITGASFAFAEEVPSSGRGNDSCEATLEWHERRTGCPASEKTNGRCRSYAPSMRPWGSMEIEYERDREGMRRSIRFGRTGQPFAPVAECSHARTAGASDRIDCGIPVLGPGRISLEVRRDTDGRPLSGLVKGAGIGREFQLGYSRVASGRSVTHMLSEISKTGPDDPKKGGKQVAGLAEVTCASHAILDDGAAALSGEADLLADMIASLYLIPDWTAGVCNAGLLRFDAAMLLMRIRQASAALNPERP